MSFCRKQRKNFEASQTARNECEAG